MGLFNLFGKKKDYEPAEVYLGLRNQILSLKAGQVESLLEPSTPLLGMLMETGYDTAVATLVAVADGTVSLYFSNGGGMLGLGEHEGPRKAALELLRFAAQAQFISRAKPTANFELPSKGSTTFFFITKTGVLSAAALENDLGNNKLPLSPLFHRAHEVISQARLVNEEMERATRELLSAAASGDESKLQELLGKNINPDAADSSGLTPLMAAAHSGQTGALKLILERAVAIDQKDSSGYTALMFACNAGNLDCVNVLLEKGANIHAEATDGSTPIMFSAQHGHNEIVRSLLEQGADPNKKGQHGLSAIGFAKQNGLTETALILEGKR
jgi:hypothetical protein